MEPSHFYATAGVRDLYTWFAGETTPSSPTWERVCRWVAESVPIALHLESLPGMKRQPNLFLATLRYLGGPTEPGPELDAWVTARWPDIERTIFTHATQTNEVGRCSVLAPVLASLPQPVALVEVGMSAGLCLLPDLYAYRWTTPDGVVRAGHSELVLGCPVSGTALPLAVPRVAWRAGIDRNPLDPADPDVQRWLRALVWPGEDARERRLVQALRLAASVPVVRVCGDATDALPAVVAQAPAGATVVVVHSAVLAYLTAEERERHLDLLRRLGVHWVTNEGRRVVPGVGDGVPEESRPHFVLALDNEPLAVVGPHGQWLHWL